MKFNAQNKPCRNLKKLFHNAERSIFKPMVGLEWVCKIMLEQISGCENAKLNRLNQ